MILFIKPKEIDCVLVQAFLKEGDVYINDATIVKTSDFSAILFDVILKDITKTRIDGIRFDSSIYLQLGLDIRNKSEIDTTLYSQKKKFDAHVLSEADNIKTFIFRNIQSEDYSRFMMRFESYQLSDRYNICADILADVSRYFRIQKRLNE